MNQQAAHRAWLRAAKGFARGLPAGDFATHSQPRPFTSLAPKGVDRCSASSVARAYGAPRCSVRGRCSRVHRELQVAR